VLLAALSAEEQEQLAALLRRLLLEFVDRGRARPRGDD
jgi:hypothetical protein